jgi:hypothetical protein
MSQAQSLISGGTGRAGDRAIAQRHRERDKLAFPVSTHIAIADA